MVPPPPCCSQRTTEVAWVRAPESGRLLLTLGLSPGVSLCSYLAAECSPVEDALRFGTSCRYCSAIQVQPRGFRPQD
ncbi:MAG: hypothetical protein ACK56I_17800, partial [bacterium]